ncbi:LysR family transcriptional regulator [Dyella solisilvae]|uniref:LysR family transcriptional regulator n=1 Tax=Dyella solisilvae TaxID=1920168 RepID=A0A370K977_9GAMM|nr:LysR family transcriptional regulator [Dyella solisilvae]RDI99191.1 LysR family transcriptional regulator [Dyella solisilvae]
MDKVDAMRLFARIVERRSFTQAAQDLELPRSTVTEAVKALEARLKVRLLERTTRQVRPTLDGEAYYQRCLAILAEIEEAEAAFTGATPSGLLRVDVQGTLARHFMLPGLPAFLARYPGIQLRIGEGDRYVDLVQEGVDCVLRVGQPADSRMVGRRIALLEEGTYASPDYLARHGTPQSPDDLAGHHMVGFVSSATGGVLPLECRVGGELRYVDLPHTLSVAGAEMYVGAARLGLGLIQVPRYRVQPDLASGALVEVLADHPPAPSPVYVLYPHSRQLSPRVRAFIDWISAEFARQLPPPPG